MSFNGDFNFSDASLILERCLVSYVVHSSTFSYTRSSIAACVVNIIFAIVGTILNSLVLYIFWKSTKLRSKLSYFVIMLLSSTDLAVVTVVHPLFLSQAINEMNGTSNCLYRLFYLFTLYFFTGMSVSTLLILNLERYTAIIHPFWHRAKMTRPRLMFIWAILWLLIVVNTVSLLFYLISAIITVMIILSLCCTSLFTYVSIFRVARKRKSVTARNTFGHHTNPGNCHGEVSGNMASFLRELKMAKTYFMIVALAFVCFLPVGITSIIDEFTYTWNKIEREPVVIAYTWIVTLTSMNSTLNCLIFFWANKMLRREAVKHVKNVFSKENSS